MAGSDHKIVTGTPAGHESAEPAAERPTSAPVFLLDPVEPDAPAEQDASAGRDARTQKSEERMRQAYDLRQQGRAWIDIGETLGITAPAASNLAKLAETRLGLPPLHRTHRSRTNDRTNPMAAEQLAKSVGVDVSDVQFVNCVASVAGKLDTEKFLEVAAAAGVPSRIAGELARRVQANYEGLNAPVKPMSDKEFADATRLVAQKMLSHMDETTMMTTSMKDLVIAFGVMVDKAQLLGGKPTSIVDFNLKQKIEVMMPKMLAEARRRGITIEGEATHVKDASPASA